MVLALSYKVELGTSWRDYAYAHGDSNIGLTKESRLPRRPWEQLSKFSNLGPCLLRAKGPVPRLPGSVVSGSRYVDFGVCVLVSFPDPWERDETACIC